MNKKLVTSLTLSSAMALGATANVGAAENPFEAKQLQGGYQMAEASEKSAEGKCGEGKCGEGACGAEDKSAKPKEDARAKGTKDAEGACGGHSKDKDAKDSEGKCGEGRCGGAA